MSKVIYPRAKQAPHNGQLLGMYRWELFRIKGSLRHGVVDFIFPYHGMKSVEMEEALQQYRQASIAFEATIDRELARVAADPQTVISELNQGYRND